MNLVPFDIRVRVVLRRKLPGPDYRVLHMRDLAQPDSQVVGFWPMARSHALDHRKLSVQRDGWIGS